MTPVEESHALAAYLMQYVGLGAVFWFGLWLAWRQGDVGLKTSHQRRWLLILVGGFVAYAAGHAFFQFIAPTL